MSSNLNQSDIKNEIQAALDWRYATKIFNKNKKISDENWNLLEDCLIKAPSSYGLQPWKFLIIKNPKLRQDLRVHTWNQSQVTDASHYVVFLAKQQLDIEHIDKHLARVSDLRGVSSETLTGYRNMMTENLLKSDRFKTIRFWAQRQAYIAMGFLLETASLLQIDACPIEGMSPEEYNKILKLENTGWETIAAVALGYRSDDDKYQSIKKVRFDKSDVIEWI